MSTDVQFHWESFHLPIIPLRAADPNPALPSQGHRSIYPYTRQYNFERELVERELDALVIENNRLKVQVLPQLSGRVWQTQNKATGLPMFHTPERVGLINFALRGAWYTGGVEFNFPNGHTVSTNETVPALVRQHPNGAMSILVGNLDLVWRVTWQVGIRLEPDSSNLHFDVQLNNRTSLPVRYMWWINSGVTAEESLEYVNRTSAVLSHFLGRRDHLGEDIAWPIHQAQDLRRYKNYVEPTSLFHLAGDDRWFGFYSHALDQGVVRVGSSAEAPGLKFWNSGQAEEGYLWGKYLTDGQRYANSELQSGRPETQTDYGVLPPHYVLRWSETWRPVWGLGGVDCCSQSVACSLRDGADQGAILRLLGDQPYPGCRVQVQAPRQLELSVDIPADQPISLQMPFPAAARPLSIQVISEDNQRLLEFNLPADGLRRSAIADVLLAEPNQQKYPSVMTTEELSLEALRLERSNLPQAARQLAEKALALDPGHTAGHLLLARLDLRQGNFAQAYQHCRLALERDPLQEWAHYMLALSELWQEHLDQALIEFERAAGRSYASSSACWFHLGELYMRAERWQDAAAAFERCMAHKANHVKAQVMKAAALRHSGQEPDRMWEILNAVWSQSPLDPIVRVEAWLSGDLEEGLWDYRGDDQLFDARPTEAVIKNTLEATFDYLASGLLEDAQTLLQAVLDQLQSPDPIAWYTLGYIKACQGDLEAARKDWEKAAQHSGEYVFAFRREEGQVLAARLEQDPQDGLALALLGMLHTANHNPQAAIPALQQAIQIKPQWDVPLRLLALNDVELGRTDEAISAYQTALAANPHNPRLYIELDELFTGSAGCEQQRTQLWADPPAEIFQDELAIGRYALSLATSGNLDEALEALQGHVFFPEEGSSQFRDLFSQIHLMKAVEAYHAGDLSQASKEAAQAAAYPEALGLATPLIRYDSGVYLLLAVVKLANGNKQEASSLMERAGGERHRETNEAEYYSALALRWLGREETARAKFERLIAQSQLDLERPERDHPYALFLGALGQAGMKDAEFILSPNSVDYPRYRWQTLCASRITQLFRQIIDEQEMTR